MHLVINQPTDRTEQVTGACIDKLYNLSKSNTLDSTSYLRGSINAASAYEDAVTFLNTMWGPDLIVTASAYYIRFADPEVESVLKTALNKAEGEGITTIEAAATNIGTIFKNNTDIEIFEELHHFSYTNTSFEGCSNLHTVDIGNKDIQPLSFRYCENLEKINGSTAESGVIIIPEGTTVVGGYMFAGCPKISVVYLPDTLTTLGYRCFRTEPSIPGTYLTEIHFGSGISQILQYVFASPNLTKVYIKDLELWAACDIQGPISNSHHLYLENDGNPVEITSIDLTGKTIINSYVFHGCSYITSVVLDTALTSIGNSAFENCTNLVIADLNLPNLTSLGTYAFSGTKVQTISDLGSVTSIPEYCFKGCSQLTTIDQGVLDNITVLNKEAFNNCTNLGSAKQSDNTISTVLRLPNLTSIALDSVRYTKFTEIADLGSITTVTGFSEMYSLTSVVLPQTCTAIGNNAFTNDTALTTINISNITSIGDGAFKGCTNLIIQDLNLPNLTSLGTTSFQNTKIQSISDLGNVTEIPASCFINISTLTTVVVPNSVTKIGSQAFRGCNVLTSITINAVTPPILEHSNTFIDTNNCPIYVPSGSVTSYQSASGWSTYASRIQAIPTT